MKHYEYLRLRLVEGRPQIFCLHKNTLESILSDLRGIIPSASVHERKNISDPSGEVMQYRLHKLSGKDYQVFLWIVKWLCQEGWEPFAVLRESRDYEYVYHFRKKIQS